MATTRYTKIIEDHVGYFWEWANNCWQMKWEPVHGRYSPPALDSSLNIMVMDVPQELLPKIAQIIGKDGYYFKFITNWSGAVYIFYRDDIKSIEIWGHPSTLEKAYNLFQCHFKSFMTCLPQS